MRRPLAGVRLSKMNTALLVAGAALLLVASLSRWVTIGGNQIAKGAPWWVLVVVGAAGVLAIAWGLAASREQLPALRTAAGFLGASPKMPDPRRLVSRPDLSQKIAAALRARDSTVALAGIGGAGKSTLAAGACLDQRVRRRFRDGVTWLERARGRIRSRCWVAWAAAWGCRRANRVSPPWRRAVTRSPRCWRASRC